eukprot:984300-Rhodomonas_salina.1
MLLRGCYAGFCTDVGYAATRESKGCSTSRAELLVRGHAARYLPRDVRCAGLVLRGVRYWARVWCYAVCGTDERMVLRGVRTGVGDSATRCAVLG